MSNYANLALSALGAFVGGGLVNLWILSRRK